MYYAFKWEIIEKLLRIKWDGERKSFKFKNEGNKENFAQSFQANQSMVPSKESKSKFLTKIVHSRC